MSGVRFNMMEKRPLVAVGQKTTNQIRDRDIEVKFYYGISSNMHKQRTSRLKADLIDLNFYSLSEIEDIAASNIRLSLPY